MVSVRTKTRQLDVHEWTLLPRKWHQLCLLRSPENQVLLLLDGRVYEANPYPANDSNLEARHKRNQKAIDALAKKAADLGERNFTNIPLIVLGSLESQFDSPVGRLTDLRVYTRLLSEADMAALRECDPESPKGSNLEVVYTTEGAVLRSVALAAVCSTERMHVVTYTVYEKQADTEALCKKLGGELPAPQNFDELMQIADILPDYSDKVEMYFWLSNTSALTTLGMSTDWCCAQDLRHGGSVPMSVPCSSWARDFVCFIEYGKSVHLLHSDQDIEMHFSDVGENYLLISDRGYSLTTENDSFVIRNLIGGQLGRREGQQVTDILGLREWIISGDVRYSITLSTCQEDQFTCSNGDCLPLQRRCDKFPDCFDGSDEDNCRYLQPPPATYRSFLPPSDSTAVTLTVNITDIHDINVSTLTLSFTRPSAPPLT